MIFNRIKLLSKNIILFLFLLIICVFVIFIKSYKYDIHENEQKIENKNEQPMNKEPINEETFEAIIDKNTKLDIPDEIDENVDYKKKPIQEEVQKQDEATIKEKYQESEDIKNTTEKVGELDKELSITSLGEFTLTAYCSCVNCCGQYALNRPLDEDGNEIVYGAYGERLIPGVSIAVDPYVIPYGTEVIINGNKYIAHDTGGAIKGNVVDLYMPDHETAWGFGRQYAEVFILREYNNEG